MKKTLDSNFVVWVDVDEVLLNFRTMFNLHLANVHNISVHPEFISNDWNYGDVIPKDMVFSEIFAALPNNWTQNQAAHDKAQKFLTDLKKLGAYIILITHVPQELSHYRIQNLVDHDMYFDEIYFTGTEKTLFSEQILRRLKPKSGRKIYNFFIDDRTKNVVEFLEKMPNVVKAVTLDLPYNQEDIKKGLNFKEKFDASSKTQSEMYKQLIKSIKQFKN